MTDAEPLAPAYDHIGCSYRMTRQADPRIAAALANALGDATSVVNVGAGTGSYEPPTTVLAVEPSSLMIAQRPCGSAPAIQASAEELPLPDDYADAALALFTVHHWADLAKGLAELRRVARHRVVVTSWLPAIHYEFWLFRDYLSELAAWESACLPAAEQVAAALGGAEQRPLLIPHDCQDGFMGAYWRRPDAYLDPEVRAGISTFNLPEAPATEEGLRRLAADLDSGHWHARNRALLDLHELDIGYRILIADADRRAG